MKYFTKLNGVQSEIYFYVSKRKSHDTNNNFYIPNLKKGFR